VIGTSSVAEPLEPQPLVSTMDAVCKMRPGYGASLERIPIPDYGPNEVLIRVRAATICGTDLHIYKWDDWAASRIKPPMPFGHEMAGDIVAVGRDVVNLAVGDYVGAESHFVCGHCYQCRVGQAHICRNVKILGVDRPGCFAEYVAIDAHNAWPTARHIPPAVAAAQEPFGNAVHTAFATTLSARTVLITGCGPIGLMAIAIAAACGASRIYATDTAPHRRAAAMRVGATEVFDALDPEVIPKIVAGTGGDGVDVLLEMSGNPNALQQGFAALRFGGFAALLGICSRPIAEFDLTNTVVFKGATVQGISGRRMFETWYQTQRLVETGKVDLKPLITHHFPLAEFETAFDLMMSGVALKCALYPHGLDGVWQPGCKAR
jgi:threonine 3-dehydrogenase